MGFFDALSCDVKLTLASTTVRVGETLRGSATFTVKKDMMVRGLRAQFKCTDKEAYAETSDCCWTRDEDVLRNEITFAGAPRANCLQEPAKKEKQPAAGVTDATALAAPPAAQQTQLLTEGVLALPAGTYVYPFEFTVPDNLPPTFLRETLIRYGEIFYTIKAYADVRYGVNASSTERVTVTAPVNAMQLSCGVPAELPMEEQQLKKYLLPMISKGSAAVACTCSTNVITPEGAITHGAPVAPPTVKVEIDLTKAKEPVRHVEITLVGRMWLHYTDSLGGHDTDEVQEVGEKVVIKGPFAAGQKHEVSGELLVPHIDDVLRRPMKHLSRTTGFHGYATRLEHCVMVELDMPWTANPSFFLPVFYTPSVDNANQSATARVSPSSTWPQLAEVLCPVDVPYLVPEDPIAACRPVPGTEVQYAIPPMAQVVYDTPVVGHALN